MGKVERGFERLGEFEGIITKISGLYFEAWALGRDGRSRPETCFASFPNLRFGSARTKKPNVIVRFFCSGGEGEIRTRGSY